MTFHRMVTISIISASSIVMSGCSPPGTSVSINPEFTRYEVHTVAVIPFQNAAFQDIREPAGGGYIWHDPQSGEMVSDVFATEFMQLPYFQCIERSQIRKILEEHKLSLADLVEKKTASEIGQLLGADAVLIGKVGRYLRWVSGVGMNGSTVEFSVRMVDVKTGIVLWSAIATRDAHSELPAGLARDASRAVVAELKRQLEDARPAQK